MKVELMFVRDTWLEMIHAYTKAHTRTYTQTCTQHNNKCKYIHTDHTHSKGMKHIIS